MVVTGGASGLGRGTARALTRGGAQATIAVRELTPRFRAADDTARRTGRAAPAVASVDLLDVDSIRAFAAAWRGPLHARVLDARVMAAPDQRTVEGWELQLATNHLGHFALATGLHTALSAAADDARVVVVSSKGHQISPVVFDDLHFRFRPYDPWLAYGQSKTANVLFAVEATRRWAVDGISANALMPGAVYTNLQRHTSGRGSGRVPSEFIKTPLQGAATSVLLAGRPELAGIGGRYFPDCCEQEVVDARSPGLGGVAHYALDPDNATRLWMVSEGLLSDAGRPGRSG